MGPSPILVPVVVGLLMLSMAILATRATSTREARAAQELAERRRRLWGANDPETGVDLLARNRVVFIAIPGWGQRLDHRLEDALGTEIGSALEQPRPGRWSKNGRRSRFTTVSVEVCDQRGARKLKIVRPSGLRWAPLEVFESGGSLLGTIVREGRARFVLQTAWGGVVGGIERRSHPHAVDYSIRDGSGLEVARISDFRHLDEGPTSDQSFWAKLRRAVSDGSEVSEHVLEVIRPVSAELRPLMLAAAAGVYLALQAPFEDGG